MKNTEEFLEFMTHEPWCAYYLDEEFEYCSCGYREDLFEGDPFNDVVPGAWN